MKLQVCLFSALLAISGVAFAESISNANSGDAASSSSGTGNSTHSSNSANYEAMLKAQKTILPAAAPVAPVPALDPAPPAIPSPTTK